MERPPVEGAIANGLVRRGSHSLNRSNGFDEPPENAHFERFFLGFRCLGLRSRTGGISMLYCFQYIKWNVL